MFYFDRLKIDQIPLRENERRINYLTMFRDLVNDKNPAFATQLRAPLSGSTGQPLDPEQRRIEINERKRMAQRMIALAQIKTQRSVFGAAMENLLKSTLSSNSGILKR
jgi:hypothetical protein